MCFLMGWRAGLAGLAFAFSSTVIAQTEQQHRVYTQAELALLQGQSVLDILKQISGFQFVDSNTERGLSNAVGNVLIDGLPVLNKSQSLEEVLANLPVNQVLSLSVYLAGHPFAGASQHTQVINIIRDESEQPINWRLGGHTQDGLTALSDVSLQGMLKWQGWEHQLQLGKNASLWGSTVSSANTLADGTKYFTTEEDRLLQQQTEEAESRHHHSVSSSLSSKNNHKNNFVNLGHFH